MAIAVDEAIRIYNMFADERSKAVKYLVRYLEQVVFFMLLLKLYVLMVHILPMILFVRNTLGLDVTSVVLAKI